MIDGYTEAGCVLVFSKEEGFTLHTKKEDGVTFPWGADTMPSLRAAYVRARKDGYRPTHFYSLDSGSMSEIPASVRY